MSPIAQEINAKCDAFNTIPFKKIRMCIGSPTSICVVHTFSKPWNSAKALFSSGYNRDATVDRDGILSKFGVTKGTYQDCPMQRPGFNIQCNDGNKGCQNDDSKDADAAIGIGIAGQSTPTEMGAGWTQFLASGAGACNANSMKFKKAWLWVASLEASSKPYRLTKHKYKPVMRIAKTSTLGFSSAYWSSDQLLNENSPVDAEEDAKYQAYLDEPVQSIRMCVKKPDSNCVTHTFSSTYSSAKELFTSGYIRDAATVMAS
ncbi:unnamed protein product [Symbiodinium pilosum]|uniref:Uncharacterized protein n=1 Tax=Symbiodinium pilosum TaxID=2952 RepID=A0A812WF25_SYMPI|nr:unnamed protein product [Symbiodinium pilosum]